MISFKTSTGRSSRRSGPRAAFSLPLVACFSGSAASAAAAAAVDAPTAWGLGTVRWLGQAWSAPRCVASACAWPWSGEEGSDCVSSSSEASGDDVLGVPGVESGEAMSLSSS
jgi:hypothetical protein